MKKSTDLRVIRTRRWLQGALRELMNERPYQKIKIAEIVYKAEVARPTFYLHYASKDELLLSLFNDLFSDFRSALQNDLKHKNVDHKLFGTLIFKYARQNAEHFRVLLEAGVEHLAQERFKIIVQEISREIRAVDPATPQSAVLMPYIDDFIASGIFTLLKRWIQEDMPIPDETMGMMVAGVIEALRAMVTDQQQCKNQ
jgi:AcrR family transcriptional regulator